MVLKRFPPDDPREWLNRAKSNLVRARRSVPGVYLEDLCFDAQQAAEKAIKAVFIKRKENFPYIHDLKKLLKLLKRNGVKVHKYLWEAHDLSQFAWETRYPGLAGPVRLREYHRLVRIAESVVRWAEGQIAKP
jgi:HEPN domain-containing protein